MSADDESDFPEHGTLRRRGKRGKADVLDSYEGDEAFAAAVARTDFDDLIAPHGVDGRSGDQTPAYGVPMHATPAHGIGMVPAGVSPYAPGDHAPADADVDTQPTTVLPTPGAPAQTGIVPQECRVNSKTRRRTCFRIPTCS